VILGGLLSATALNMVVLPALYLLFGVREVTVTDTVEIQTTLGVPALGRLSAHVR
jgi:hypothetical protein